MLFSLIVAFTTLALSRTIRAEICAAELDLDFQETPQESHPDVFSSYSDSLRTIRLKGFLFDADLMGHFSELLKKNPDLTELSFDQCNLNMPFLARIPFKALTQLKILKIINSQLIIFDFDCPIFDWFPSSLVHLEIVMFWNYQNNSFPIKLNFEKFVNLRTLILSGFYNSSFEWSNTLQTIPFPECITVLHLTNAAMRNLEKFFENEGPYELRELCLHHNQISFEKKEVQNCLKRCTKLEVLDISHNDLFEMDFLSDLFGKNEFLNLKSLILTQTNPVCFNRKKSMNWLANLNLKCLHFEGKLNTGYFFSAGNMPFEELLLSSNFTVRDVNFKNLKRLAISGKSLAQLDVKNFLVLQELKIFHFPNTSNHEIIFDIVGRFRNLSKLTLVWMETCNNKILAPHNFSIYTALSKLKAVKSFSFKSKKIAAANYFFKLMFKTSELESFELDVPSYQSLIDWEKQIGKFKNLKSLSLRLNFTAENLPHEFVLFKDIEQFNFLRSFEFSAPAVLKIDISKAIDKMPNLISLEVSEVTLLNAINFFTLSCPKNVRILKIQSSKLHHKSVHLKMYSVMKFFPKLNNLTLTSSYDLKIINATFNLLALAQLIPALAAFTESSISTDHSQNLIRIFEFAWLHLPLLHENIQLRNKKILPFLDKKRNPVNWEYLEKRNSSEVSTVVQIINEFLSDLDFEDFCKFSKIYNSYSIASKETFEAEPCKKMLQLIFVKKQMQNKSIKKLKKFKYRQYSNAFYVKQAKEFFSRNPHIDRLTFVDFVEITCVQFIMNYFKKNLKNTAYLIQQNPTIIEDIAQLLESYRKDAADATVVLEAFNAATENNKIFVFMKNYEPNSTIFYSFLKIFWRYFGPKSTEFIKAVENKEMTEKDKEFLMLVYGNEESIGKFTTKIAKFSPRWKEIHNLESNSPILLFALNFNELNSVEKWTVCYHDFLGAEIEICPICLGNDFTMNLNFKKFNGLELVCSHRFHKSCMISWLNAGSTTCPVCRQELRPIEGQHQPEPFQSTRL